MPLYQASKSCVYISLKNSALCMVLGPFWSTFKSEEKLSTLASVSETPHALPYSFLLTIAMHLSCKTSLMYLNI